MKRFFRRLVPVFVGLMITPAVHPDPMHPVADGAFWHHDSNWIFPAKIGEFEIVGAAQEVAGSTDAVAHYAHGEGESRVTATVDVYRLDSPAAAEREIRLDGDGSPYEAITVGKSGQFPGTTIFQRTGADAAFSSVATCVVAVGEWRVRIFVTVPQKRADSPASIEAFVLGQRWDTLAGL